MILRSTLLCLALLSAVPASAIPTVGRSAPSLRALAEQGDPGAMARLGWHYYHGEGLPKDMAEAVKWFRAAAELNDRSGMFGLGVCLEEGKGIAKDEARALSFYREAGVTEPIALYRQATMLLDGRGTARDRGAVQALVDAGMARGEATFMLELVSLLIGNDRVEDAEPFLQRIMRHPASAALHGELAFIKAVGYVGEAYRDVGRFHEARSWLLAKIALLEKLPLQNGAAMSEARQELSLVDAISRQQAMAGGGRLQAAELLRRTYGREGGELADHYAYVAHVYQLGDFFIDAEHYRRRAMTLNEEAGRLDTVPALSNLASLGGILHTLGRYDEAASLLAQVVERISAVRGDTGKLQWLLLSRLAENQLALGQPDVAEVSYRKLLALSDKHQGNGPNEMRGIALRGLGVMYARSRHYGEAETLLRQALGIHERLPKQDLFPAAVDLMELGKLFTETGRYREAELHLARALEILGDIPSAAGWDSAAVLHEMGRNHAKQGDHGQAAACLTRAYVMRSLAQRTHPLTLESGAALASAYRSLDNQAAARRLEERLAKMAQEVAPRDWGIR